MTKGRAGLLAVAAIVVVGAVVAGLVWFGPLGSDSDGKDGGKAGPTVDPARALVDRFAAGWQAGDISTLHFTQATPTVVLESKAAAANVSSSDQDHPAIVVVKSFAHGADTPAAGGTGTGGTGTVDHASAQLQVTWKLDATRTWTYVVKVLLERPSATTTGDRPWAIAWAPSVVEPSLQAGETLHAVRVQPVRGEVLGAGGVPIVGLRDVVEVGIQPSRATDLEGLARQVAGIVKVDPDALVARVKAAKPDQFVSVITLRREAYELIKAQIQPLPGTVFHEDKRSLAPSKDFAQALLGSVGPATAEIVAASKGRIAATDQTGLSGLQRSQDPVLAGTAGLTIEAVPPATATTQARTLKAFPAVPGKSITTTLDPKVQTAADQVMANAPKPAALVAIRVSTGDVLAVSNGPTAAAGYNRAMIGHYPPGSTFKVASGLTLLEHGVTPDTPVACPATIVVGKEFQNAENEVLGTVPFRTDFAKSCNTAFVGQSRTITSQQLTDTAGLLGYRTLDLGVPVFGGSVPVSGDATEHAANMIGQGKVEASPFAVALASASVAAGKSLTPRLIVDPTKPVTPGAALPPAQIAQLHDLMRGVVTSGTGTSLNGVPGGDVFGKTGTAEFGTEVPPQTHAWFTGFQGDIAFAVLVEDGGFGATAAAPLAAQFLTKLATP